MKKHFLQKPATFIFLSLASSSLFAGPTDFIVGAPLPKWEPHYLDIDHLNTGAGNATFMIFPDGTTLLYDMGDVETAEVEADSLPEYSQKVNPDEAAYTWVADFIKQVSPHPDLINYAVISHFHFDHFGEWSADEPTFQSGGYKLTGITGLASEIHIGTLLDRSYPDYTHHGDIVGNLSQYLNTTSNVYAHQTALTMQNYQRFIQYQTAKNGLHVEQFQGGSDQQIHLVYTPESDFQVQNIIGNGEVWTGKQEGVYPFIRYAPNDQGDAKKENDLSNGLRIDYGMFRYFTGGDMTGRNLAGGDIAGSAEAVAAPVIGKVDVATMDHHGFDDAQSDIFVQTLRPQVWVQQNWAASQTSLAMLLRTTDLHLYNYPRDLFALAYFKLDDLAIPSLGGLNHQDAIEAYYKNTNGDVVIRVAPGGTKFWVIMLESGSTVPIVKAVYGPYFSTAK